MMKKNFFLMAVLYFFTALNSYAQQTPNLTKLTEHVYAYIGITQASPGMVKISSNELIPFLFLGSITAWFLMH
jgi:hypothetical protein